VRDGDYTFRMPQPSSSYLMAIAAGDLVFAPISERAGVWAEPAMAPKAAKEFEDTEKMIEAAEKLYGPYRWERYDLLVLPASFPFGGMENPRLTFATPTVIVGDKSLTSLIAHELAHSWSGNLVTNSSWKDIWLNEGFTTYVEGRIVEAVFGREQTEMEEVISQFGLKQDMAKMEPFAQRLALDPLLGRDPDEALSDVAYIKGAWFLQFLERRYGRADFDAFLRGYFDQHAFQSIDSATFASYAKQNLLAKYPGKVGEAEFDAWLHAPGIPSIAEPAHSARFDVVDTARADWLAGERAPSDIATSKWSTQEWVRFLEGMPDKLQPAQLAALDAAFHFTGTPNGEIAMRWYPLAVRSGYAEARPAIETFLVAIGRRKLVMPTWEALAATPDGLAFARGVFAKARPGMHPITAHSVEAALAKAKTP
jgi:leukotriene-A4 hydrolase